MNVTLFLGMEYFFNRERETQKFIKNNIKQFAHMNTVGTI